jgi:hypothetical protein
LFFPSPDRCWSCFCRSVTLRDGLRRKEDFHSAAFAARLRRLCSLSLASALALKSCPVTCGPRCELFFMTRIRCGAHGRCGQKPLRSWHGQFLPAFYWIETDVLTATTLRAPSRIEKHTQLYG